MLLSIWCGPFYSHNYLIDKYALIWDKSFFILTSTKIILIYFTQNVLFICIQLNIFRGKLYIK